MPTCLLVKTDQPGMFLDTDGVLKDLQPGEIITVSYKYARNPIFHRKAFKLFRFIFDAMPDPEPVRHRGMLIYPQKDFDVTRKYLTVQAGFYEVVGLPDGSVRLNAKSLSYENMDNDEFKKVYSALIDVGIQVLPYTMTGEQLDKAINNLLMGFA